MSSSSSTRELADLQAQAATRNDLSARKREAERELALFEKQLAELSVNGYDRDAHEQVRQALTEATAAETHCSELHAQAAQIELLEARLTREEQLASDARTAHDDLAAAAAQHAPDKDAPQTAEQALDEADRAHGEANTAVHNAEQQALAESNAVAQARADLETAQRLTVFQDAPRRALRSCRAMLQQPAAKSPPEPATRHVDNTPRDRGAAASTVGGPSIVAQRTSAHPSSG